MPAKQTEGETASTRRNSVSEDVIEQIKSLVRSDEYKPGSRLPSERDLARQLGVSRPSIRHALSALAQMGILETRQGSGTIVAGSSANVLRAPFEYLMLLEHPSVFELYEVRELIEVYLAGRAAERRTGEDMVLLDAAFQAMQRQDADNAYRTAGDIAFHQTIATAAHMPMLTRILACLQDGIAACMESARPAVHNWLDSYSIHEHILEAIRKQSATEARHAMTIHMAMAVEELRRLHVFEEDKA